MNACGVDCHKGDARCNWSCVGGADRPAFKGEIIEKAEVVE